MNQNYNASIEQQNNNFKNQQKTIFKSLYASAFLAIVFLIIGIVASAKISKDYQYVEQLQTATIVMCCLTICTIFLCIYITVSPRFSRNKKLLGQVLYFVCCSAVMGMMFFSLLKPLLNIYCGYYIEHNGFTDGFYIITTLETNSKYPSCLSMQNNSQYSVRDQLVQNSVKVIAEWCQTDQSCYDLSSLRIDKWSDMFSFILVALIGILISYIIFVVFISIINFRFKKFQDQMSQNALLQNAYQNGYQPNNQQNQYNNQMYQQNQNQPYQQNWQNQGQNQYPNQQNYPQYLPPQQHQINNSNSNPTN